MQESTNISDELHRLQVENARLRALLAQHGIFVNEPKLVVSKPVLSLEEKVKLLSFKLFL